MFNSLTGRITYKGNGIVHLLNNGIEWALFCSIPSLSELPEMGEEGKLFVYLYHKEDQMKLFGFSTEAERQIFLDLLKVSGIGSRLALKILSG
ncbi:MAG: Holliday junction branch migration protein RuvA, partial [Spirochaetota bacterium]